MGMAAGQARLLSITTRMSDNELRAQLINNDKMRLATKSSQVSEAYTTALNEAQMMFTNYDADNKTSYKELTYNALTAYNPYNNQYAISNASGQVLVSETDATNFKNANGDLNTFLKSYGLEYSTDYFSSLIGNHVVTPEEGSPYLEYKTGIFDDDGDEILDRIDFAENNDYGGTSLSEVLKNMYIGIPNSDHPGYDVTKSSQDYLNYTGYLSDYTSAYNTMMSVVSDKMSIELMGTATTGGVKFSDLYDKMFSDETVSYTDLDNLSKIITELKTYAADDGKNYLTELDNSLNDYKTNNNWLHSSYSNGTLKRSSDSTSTTLTYSDMRKNEKNEDEEFNTKLVFTKSGTNYTMKVGANSTAITGTVNGSNVDFTYYINSEGQTISTTEYNALEPAVKVSYIKGQKSIDTSLFDAGNYKSSGDLKNAGDIGKLYSNTEITDDDRKDIGKKIVETIQESITNIWDVGASNGTQGAFTKFTDAPDGTYYKTFIDTAKKFYLEMFGKEIGTETNPLPPSSKDILYNMGTIEALKKAIETSATSGKQKAFKKIYDVYVLDCVMNTYGEPKFSWIDQKDKNANGEKKAQWYTNLFNRMKSGGYKTLQDGLASSTEWIKFAFESGLVTLEQVDSKNAWNSTTYSNCSDITEQTDTTAVTIAEAEYNAQMTKIQNKDKMYDLELKNIDTEHNSLQTEYESIKGAIDKNIERTFKIYS